MGPAGTRPQVKVSRGEEWFKEWRRKDRTYNGESTGVGRDASDVEVRKGGETRRGKRRPKRYRGTGVKGPAGTWGAC